MGKKKNTSTLGKSIIRDRFKTSNLRRNEGESWLHTSDLNDGYDWGRLNLNSVTEQSHLDDFLLTAELAGTEFTAERQNIRVVDPLETGLPSANETRAIKEAQELNKDLLCIPRRPKWDDSTTKDKLAQKERESFLEWRRQLAILQEKDHIVMTPFERNLEFWRQLWRVIERSDIIVQIVDARNPLLFRCEDLEKYVKEVGSSKENMVLISKADLLNEQQRQQWAEYFSQQGLRVAFWSAVLETERIKQEAASEKQDTTDTESTSSEDSQPDDEEGLTNNWSRLLEDQQPMSEDHDPDASHDERRIDEQNHQLTPSSEIPNTQAPKIESDTPNSDVTDQKRTADDLDPDAPNSRNCSDCTENNVHLTNSNESANTPKEKFVKFVELGTESHKEDSTTNTETQADSARGCVMEGGDRCVLEDIDGCGPGQGAVRTGVVNSSKLLTGEELIQLFYDVHSGPKVQEGITTVGMVGYPNVGKSSTINALLQRKKVPVSATPGRTKHFQTLFVEPTMCLCDCPGLVMPSLISSKAEMIISGILCIDHLRDFIPPVSLLCQRIPRHILNSIYGINIIKPRDGEDLNRTPTAREFLNAYAYMRGFMTNHGMPDGPRAARVVLKDYVKGKLLYCHPTPGVDAVEFQDFSSMKGIHQTSADAVKPQHEASGPVVTEEGTRLKKQPTSSKLDEAFFSQRTVTSHTKGPIGPRGFVHGQGPQGQEPQGQRSQQQLSASQQRLIDKPWKKHDNRNKREKLRRVYGHLDE